MSKRYFGSWASWEGMRDDFFPKPYSEHSIVYPVPDDFPSDDMILFASYGGASYEGDAVVIYLQDDKLYEVHASHCSCYGLEEQWAPEQTDWGALAIRSKKDNEDHQYFYFLSDHDGEAVEAFWNLVEDNK